MNAELADLVPDHMEMARSAHLEDKQLFFLQCAMEENCLAASAATAQVCYVPHLTATIWASCLPSLFQLNGIAFYGTE